MKVLTERNSMDDMYDEDSETEALQELFAAGKLKPGLNLQVEKKVYVNNVDALNKKLKEIESHLPWTERFDIVGGQAELAPELSMELREQEDFVKSGRKDAIAFNEFKRETLFHRQAQLAAMEALARMKSQKLPLLRPQDYFAEMMKSDEHMQKVRHSILEKKAGLERSEKVKKIRAEKKLAKQKQVESTLRKHKEKRNLSEEIKKYRKGIRTDLDFLENKPQKNKKRFNSENQPQKGKANSQKFKYGNKQKKNKNFKKGNKPQRPGKSKRAQMKQKRK